MSLKMMGKKVGMMQLFDESGSRIVCTVVAIEPNAVVQIKTEEKEGYAAVQLGAGTVAEQRLSKPQKGHFTKAGVSPRERLLESKSAEAYEVGAEIGAEYFTDVTFVDATGCSKGKGFQGVMKRHNFRGGPAAHGSGFHRAAGSTGMRSTPGRVFPGHSMPGRMGGEQCVVEGLRVIRVDAEKGFVIVKGAIPGAKGSWVALRKSKKKEK